VPVVVGYERLQPDFVRLIKEVEAVDHQQLERIRNPRFPLARRGYEPREVDHFMLGLADWLENGGVDEAGSYAVTRRLERAGETTARLLAAAQAEADHIVKDAETDARRRIAEADEASRKKLEQTRAQAHDMVEEATRQRDSINTTIGQLRQVQRHVLGDIDRLRELLAAAVEATPQLPAHPAELPPPRADAKVG
jgi:vacuolar-type H+-ATPase subunit H